MVSPLHDPHQDVEDEGDSPPISAVGLVVAWKTLESVPKPHVVVDVQEVEGQESGVSSVVPIALRPSDVGSLHETARTTI